ncbi:MAG: hypothetical protein QOE22_571 [Candidatus Parcubacteria bacterium]|jgi:hypothetical protein|nr:hypothetical protein [Candidatus Parcubacteria bacterium]
MSEVQFTEESFHTSTKKKPSRGLTALLIRAGFAKDERQAGMLMLVVAAICIVAAIAFIALSTGGPGPLSPEERRQLEESTRPR